MNPYASSYVDPSMRVDMMTALSKLEINPDNRTRAQRVLNLFRRVENGEGAAASSFTYPFDGEGMHIIDQAVNADGVSIDDRSDDNSNGDDSNSDDDFSHFLDNEDDVENADDHHQGGAYEDEDEDGPAIISVSEHSSDIDHDDDFLSQEDDSFFNDDDDANDANDDENSDAYESDSIESPYSMDDSEGEQSSEEEEEEEEELSVVSFDSSVQAATSSIYYGNHGQGQEGGQHDQGGAGASWLPPI